MGRMIPVLVAVLVLGVTVPATLLPILECPECPAEFDCIRCRKRGRISVLESRRREPLHPTLAHWLRSRGSTASLAADLAMQHGRSRVEMLGWKTSAEYFFYSDITLVDGPDGPLALAILRPKVQTRDDDSASRVLLFDRRGRELDRWDISMPGGLAALDARLLGKQDFIVRMEAIDRDGDPAGDVLATSGSRRVFFPRRSWPQGWERRGVARVVVRDGKLEVVPP